MKENDFEDTEVEVPRESPAGPVSRPTWAAVRSGLRAWANHTFAASSLLGGLKSLAWVAPLSVLIWIYAEREQVATNYGFTVNVQVRSLDSSRVVRFSDGFDGKVRGDFSGPQGGLEQVREKLESGSPLMIELTDGELTPGDHSIVSTRLNEDPMLVRNGVSISNCVPRNVNFAVDAIEEISVDVQAPPEAKNIVGTPTFEPRKVKVSAPRAVLNSFARITAYPDLASIKGSLDAGTHDLPSVPITVAGARPVAYFKRSSAE